MPKVRTALSFVRRYGFLQTSIYALFRIWPRLFVLLDFRGTGVGAPISSSFDYEISLRFVNDYRSWRDLGGAAAPVPAISDNSHRPCFIWFVPNWTNVWGGGHYTLFRFANHFAKHNVRQIIYIYNNSEDYGSVHYHDTPDKLQNDLNGALEDCKIEVIVDPALLPACDAAFATTWQSAYTVRSFPFAAKKFYFMQDYESTFYAFGTSSMQANNTYTFGFAGVTGGNWLRSIYESYGNQAMHYTFATDRDIFYPANAAGTVCERVARLFFYARPSTERRCFELGIAALARIAAEFPDVEIVIAGLNLRQPPPFKATLLGNLTLRQTGGLYRTCDIGMAFSGTNLSYLPVELMASGCPVLTNNGAQTEWMCRHDENAYLADPVPAAIVDGFRALYNSKELRQKLATGGLRTTADLNWNDEMEKIYRYVDANLLKKQEAA